jgi:site-specific DNA-cytosine methylase
LYWTNIPGIEQPEDKGLLLKDILQDLPFEEPPQYLLNKFGKKTRGELVKTPNEKSRCLNATMYKGQISTFVKRPCDLKEFNKDSTCHHTATATDIKGNESIKRVYADSGKSPTLTTMGGGHREPKVLCGRIVGRKINPETGKRDDYNPDLKTKQRFEGRFDEKSGCLTTVQKDNVLYEHPTYRKLTPLECERLQTVDDYYTDGVSNTQRYKMLGNGWTVDIICHVLKNIREQFARKVA